VFPGGKSAELDPNPNSDCQDPLGRRLVVRVNIKGRHNKP
jgi:hypothetical protein